MVAMRELKVVGALQDKYTESQRPKMGYTLYYSTLNEHVINKKWILNLVPVSEAGYLPKLLMGLGKQKFGSLQFT